MAGELEVDHTTGKTVYFQLRNSAGQIWNTAGSAFEAYQTAHVTDYDIAGTEQGTASGYYTGSMPAVAAGVYNALAKERAGGSPAESDRTVGAGTVEWDGSAVRPSVVLADGVAHGGATATFRLGSSDGTIPFRVTSDLGDAVSFECGDGFGGSAFNLNSQTGDAIHGVGGSRGLSIGGQSGNAIYTSLFGGPEAALHLFTLGTGSGLKADHGASGYGFEGTLSDTDGVADRLLGRNIAGSSDGGRTVKDALRSARNKVAFDVPVAGQFTVYAEDDTQVAWVGTYNRGASGLGPLTSVDPA